MYDNKDNRYYFVIYITDCAEATRWCFLLESTLFGDYLLLCRSGKIISDDEGWRICRDINTAEKRINNYLNEMMKDHSIGHINNRRLQYTEQLLKLRKKEVEDKEKMLKILEQIKINKLRDKPLTKGAVRWLKSAISKLGIL